jgi:hypothetical protein
LVAKLDGRVVHACAHAHFEIADLGSDQIACEKNVASGKIQVKHIGTMQRL